MDESEERTGEERLVETTHRRIGEEIERFLETADAGRAFGAPVKRGDTTLIPAAEVLTVLGFGLGAGRGGEAEGDSGGGGGGGGGGRTLSRAVAVVVASPEGVEVRPVVDVTKIAVAALTAGGLVVATLWGMVRPEGWWRRLREP